jgi:hypothetical protein
MQAQSLADLKAQNAVEQEVAEETVVSQEQEVDAPKVEVDQVDQDKPEESEKPEWAKSDAVPVAKHVEMKHKLKAQLKDVTSENEQLKQRLAALDAPKQEQKLSVPTLASCDFDEEAYQQKMIEYSAALVSKQIQEFDSKKTENSQREQVNQRIGAEVDKHYERASELVASGLVTPENFQAAEMLVRRAVADSVGGDADLIANYLIANLGEGSEKVVYHLGINPQALSTFKSSLALDPHGIRAAAYLGELKAKFNSAPINKLSNAPKPDVALSGTSSAQVGADHKAYKKAESSGNLQQMLTVKRAAKARGIDTTNW